MIIFIKQFMVKIFVLLVCLIAAGSTINLYSQTQFSRIAFGVDNDSLPADGQSTIETKLMPNGPDDNCKVKITYVSGDVMGVRWDTLITFVCEQTNKDTIITRREVDLQVNNTLTPPTHIKTGDNSRVEITYPDGSVARIGPNSDVQLEEAFCQPGVQQRDLFKEILGEIWAAATHALGGDNVTIETNYGFTGVRGTIFSVKSGVSNGDTVITVRTYDGEVDFTKTAGTDKTLTSAQDQLKQLQDDYKNGKITMQEFQEQALKLESNANEYNKSSNTVTVQSGYQTVIKKEGPPSTPEKFDPDPNAWFMDSNFGK